jgi:hypothetical protein
VASFAQRPPGGGLVVPTPPPGDGDPTTVQMRVWRRGLPVDRLAGVPGVAASVTWSASARFRRVATPIDIPPESRAGMAGVFGEDHPH